MLTIGSATRIYLAAGVTDMRKSFNGLHGIVESVLRRDPLTGHLFVFCNRSRNRIKILFWDGSGLWVCAKRLEQGTFSWPETTATAIELDHEELSMLIGGIDLGQSRPRRWYRRHAKSSPKNRESMNASS
jgi:transposase